MIKATVDEFSEMYSVTPKTVRSWIEDGMPVVRAGSKGPSHGAQIDLVRAALWLRKQKGHAPSIMADFFGSDKTAPTIRSERWLSSTPTECLTRSWVAF